MKCIRACRIAARRNIQPRCCRCVRGFHASWNSREAVVTVAAQATVAAEAAATAATRNATSRPVAFWLFGTAAAVGAMVTVGGVTRLTRSGLSMTDWKLQGSLPPRSREEWEAEFERYKRFPEYQQRRSMTLEDFKFIYWWEYGHRMLGRTLGVIYVLPLCYFAARGRIPSHLRGKLAALLCLGGGQGLVGWWMVKSGLQAEALQRREVRVSPYRLAAHLGVAFTTFSLLLHTGLEALHGPGGGARASASAALERLRGLDAANLKRLLRVRGLSHGVAGLAFLTALSGAFVAGNDAGRAYNVFPWMEGDRWLPQEILDMQPLWRNFFENTATVQADHRLLAVTTVAAAVSLFAFARFGGGGAAWAAMTPQARTALAAAAAVSTGQASLGIWTLLAYVPLPLAAAHQAGALGVLGTSVWAIHSMRYLKGARGIAAAAAQKLAR